MSSQSKLAEHEREVDHVDAPDNDRRKNERQIATFRTCCVMVDGKARPAILRNMSDGGAMFEALVAAKPDSKITYWWDGIDMVEARVAWADGNRIGVANLSGPATRVDVPRPRATRIPVRLPVRIWSGPRVLKAEMENISMSGLAVHGIEGLAPGTLVSIELGGQTLPNASVVRHEGEVTGIKFERPLSPAKLMQLLPSETSDSAMIARPAPAPAPAAPPEPQPVKVEQPEAEEAPRPAPVRRFL